jgi:hypothetical protein
MKNYDVVVAGYLCIDLIPDFNREKTISSISNLLVPGRLMEIDGLSYNWQTMTAQIISETNEIIHVGL